MKYSVDSAVFELNPSIMMGILVADGIKNSPSTAQDSEILQESIQKMQAKYSAEEVRDLPGVAFYREVLTRAQINPNKFPPSVEAMFKRITKGGTLPEINALVDLCNAVSITHGISLGAHDLADMPQDLSVRFSQEGDIFLPFGEEAYEEVETGELVFASGNVVQVRKWVWRQSELGKITKKSENIFFQLAFDASQENTLKEAMSDIENLIKNRFGGNCKTYFVDKNNPTIEW